MADMMQGIKNQFADALEHPEQFGGESWSAAQTMIGNLAGVSLDGMRPERALAEFPWLPKFLRTGQRPGDEGETDDEIAAREQAAAAREQRLAPLHEANDRRSALAYEIAAERGIDPGDWAGLQAVYDDPRFTEIDAEINRIKAVALS